MSKKKEVQEMPAAEVSQPIDSPLVEAASTVIEAFVAWAKSDEPLEDLQPFVSAGLLDEDHSLTDEGASLLDSEGIPYRYLNFIELGVPVTYRVDGKPITINAGSKLQVRHGGYDDALGAKFWVCDAGMNLPETVIYQNRLHIHSVARYPATQPLNTEYSSK